MNIQVVLSNVWNVYLTGTIYIMETVMKTLLLVHPLQTLFKAAKSINTFQGDLNVNTVTWKELKE